MAKNKNMPDEKNREAIAVRECGEHGRITVPAELRQEFGGRYMFVKTADGIELEPVEEVTN